MAVILTNNQHYRDIAAAIRSQTGETSGIKPAEMALAISAIETGASGSSIVVTSVPGSTVWLIGPEGNRKDALEQSGTWTFRNCGLGVWTVNAVLDSLAATDSVTIQEEGQLMRYEVELGYTNIPNFTYTGTYRIEDDAGNELKNPANYNGDFRVLFLTSGSLLFTNWNGGGSVFDLFFLGAGGSASAGGGGSGYTKTVGAKRLELNVPYELVIGAGGIGPASWADAGSDGGSTAGFGESVSGGKGGGNKTDQTGGKGGSGGGAANISTGAGVDGGTNGGNGKNSATASGGAGQGTTTREFGEPEGVLYAPGGSGYKDATWGEGLTGDNSGCGGAFISGKKNGGSGVIVLRNTREVA